MDLTAFRDSLSGAEPPAGIGRPLAALWRAARGDWDGAHATVQADESAEAAWVHAYLHRVEGDLANARYWYRTAGRTVATGTLHDEWAAIAAELLGKR